MLNIMLRNKRRKLLTDSLAHTEAAVVAYVHHACNTLKDRIASVGNRESYLLSTKISLNEAVHSKNDPVEETVKLNIGGNKVNFVINAKNISLVEKVIPLLLPRWSRYLQHDNDGRIFLDINIEWIRPILDYLCSMNQPLLPYVEAPNWLGYESIIRHLQLEPLLGKDRITTGIQGLTTTSQFLELQSKVYLDRLYTCLLQSYDLDKVIQPHSDANIVFSFQKLVELNALQFNSDDNYRILADIPPGHDILCLVRGDQDDLFVGLIHYDDKIAFPALLLLQHQDDGNDATLFHGNFFQLSDEGKVATTTVYQSMARIDLSSSIIHQPATSNAILTSVESPSTVPTHPTCSSAGLISNVNEPITPPHPQDLSFVWCDQVIHAIFLSINTSNQLSNDWKPVDWNYPSSCDIRNYFWKQLELYAITHTHTHHDYVEEMHDTSTATSAPVVGMKKKHLAEKIPDDIHQDDLEIHGYSQMNAIADSMVQEHHPVEHHPVLQDMFTTLSEQKHQLQEEEETMNREEQLFLHELCLVNAHVPCPITLPLSTDTAICSYHDQIKWLMDALDKQLQPQIPSQSDVPTATSLKDPVAGGSNMKTDSEDSARFEDILINKSLYFPLSDNNSSLSSISSSTGPDDGLNTHINTILGGALSAVGNDIPHPLIEFNIQGEAYTISTKTILANVSKESVFGRIASFAIAMNVPTKHEQKVFQSSFFSSLLLDLQEAIQPLFHITSKHNENKPGNHDDEGHASTTIWEFTSNMIPARLFRYLISFFRLSYLQYMNESMFPLKKDTEHVVIAAKKVVVLPVKERYLHELCCDGVTEDIHDHKLCVFSMSMPKLLELLQIDNIEIQYDE